MKCGKCCTFNMKQRTRLLYICYGSFVLLALTVALPATSLKFIAQTFNLNYTQRGIFLAFSCSALLAAVILGGLISNTVSRKLYLTSGLYILSAGLLLEGFSPNYPSLLAGAFMVGWGNGTIEVLASPIISDMFPERRASKLNLGHFFFSLGVVIGSIFAGYMIVRNIGWRPSFLIISLFSLFLAVASSSTRFVEEKNPAIIGTFILRLFKNRLFLLLSIAMFLTAGTEIGVCSWLPNYMNQRFSFSALGGGLSLAFLAFAMGAGRLIYSKLTDRYDYCLLMEISSLGSLFCIISAVIGKNPLTAIISFGLLGLFLSGFWPTILAYAGHRIKGPSVTLFSLIVICGITGTLIFPYLIGLVANESTLRIGLSILIIPMLFSTIIFATIHYKEKGTGCFLHGKEQG